MRLSSLFQRFALRAAVALFAFVAPAMAQDSSFEVWMLALKLEARSAGISQATIETALSGVVPIQRVTELDRKQPEFTQTFWDYLDKRVTPGRVARARQLLSTHRVLLNEVKARYGVQPRFLVSFWGLESNFGSHTGGFSVIQALVTLAYDERRAEFFRAQLLDALRIIDKGHIAPEAMQGSWAGAMGQVQFIPSTFMRHAVDFDGDRRKDLWHSLPDVFASAANYLSAIGWRGDETWGREVRLPKDFDYDLADLNTSKPIGDWQALGVRRPDGSDLPRANMAAAIVLPAGHTGPVFMVYNNYHSILRWNRSILYAIAVGHLADRIAGLPALATKRLADEKPLRRADVKAMQDLLASLGFDAGVPDGVVGAKTRAALKGFQRKAGLAADGYPTYDILETLRKSAPSQASSD